MKILIPTDFSDNARMAIDYVYTHFIREMVQVTLMHTVKAPASTSGVLIRIDDLMKKDAEDAMDQELAYVEDKYGVRPLTAIHFGFLKDWVSKEVESKRIDLVVMGTKGESNVASKMMGSVTESMIRFSTVPVMAIPQELPRSTIDHISVASDDLHNARQESVMKILNVMNTTLSKVTYVYVDKGEASLNLPKGVQLGGQHTAVHIEENKSVVAGINNFLDEYKPDLLIMFHKHTSMFDYLFNRSVTKTICSKTKLPLLVFPGK